MPVAPIIGGIAGLLQTGIGLFQQGKANKELKKLFKQRKAYETPKEVFDMLNTSQYLAQSGFDSNSLNYMTNQADRGLATGIGAATRLGADPNAIAGLTDQHFQDILKIGSDNSVLQLQNFDRLLNAKNLVAENKTAEWQSRENLIKDLMQAQSQKVGAGQQNIQSGLNLGMSALTALDTGSLWEKYLKTQQGQTDGTLSSLSAPNNTPVELQSSRATIGTLSGGLNPIQTGNGVKKPFFRSIFDLLKR